MMRRRFRFLNDIAGEIGSHPLITLGFSLFWIWVWIVVQSSFLNSSIIAEVIPGISRWVIPLAAYALTFLAMGLLYRRLQVFPFRRSYLVSLAATASLGVVVSATFSVFPTSSRSVTFGLLVFGGLLIGAATAGIHIEWGRLLACLGPRKTIVHGASGTFGAMLLLLLIYQLPPDFIWIVLALLPFACMATIILQQRSLPVERQQVPANRLKIPWRFWCTSFIQGTAFGILQTLLLMSGKDSLTAPISAVGSLAGAVVVLVVALHLRFDFNQLIYQVGFVLLALSFALMDVAGSFFIGGWLINAIGYRFIDILMWALCVYLIKQRGLPTNWVFGMATFALIIGQVCGAVVGMLSQQVFAGSNEGSNVLSVAMVFVILTGALLMFNINNLKVGWGMIRPGDRDEKGEELRSRCMLLTDGYGLTAREFELFCLMAEGMGRTDISEKLYLSRETVKTHTRNIYRKMNLHSQEEVQSLVARHRGTKSDEPSEHIPAP